MEHLARADRYAARAHHGQYRKSRPGAKRTPYIEHPRAVVGVLREAGIADDVALMAALLHYTIEDCGETKAGLAIGFGDMVADLVVELTNPEEMPDGKNAAQVAKARGMSRRATWVKKADKIAILRDLLTAPPDWSAARIRAYFDDARRVVDAMPYRHEALDRLFDEIFARGTAT